MPFYQTYNYGLETKKNDLLVAVQETQRGLVASSDQRCVIEEALVCFISHSLSILFIDNNSSALASAIFLKKGASA